MQLLADCLCVNWRVQLDNEAGFIPGMAGDATLADASAGMFAKWSESVSQLM